MYINLALKNAELRGLVGSLLSTLVIRVPLQKVRKNEEPVYPLRSKVPEGTNKYPFQKIESSDTLNWNGYTCRCPMVNIISASDIRASEGFRNVNAEFRRFFNDTVVLMM
jgi:hypothetical protein